MGCIGNCAINENNHMCCLECPDHEKCPMRCDSLDEYEFAEDCPDYVEEEKMRLKQNRKHHGVDKGEKDMEMLEWAKNEVAIATKRERGDKPENERDYGVACYESAMKAFESLLKDGHSGMSIGFTKAILNRLIDGKPLTAIKDTEDIWTNKYTISGDAVTVYQCKRMGSLFKYVYPDGKIIYRDNQRTYCVNTESPEVDYHNGFIRQIYDEMYPITMPYMPNDKPDAIVCDELLTDRKNGDFDTIAILYIKRSDGEKVEVNRYFKWKENGFVEITGREYFQREIMDKQREEKEIEESYENC